MKFPRPLQPGDHIGITAPSHGVPDAFRARFEFAVELLQRRGFIVDFGECLFSSDVASASALARAAELQRMLIDPEIRAVVPPWGGQLAIEVVSRLDYEQIAAAEPTWFVGYSDMSLLMLALTTRTNWATLYGGNLLDTPFRVPAPLLSWLDVACSEAPEFRQGNAVTYRANAFDDFRTNPLITEYTLNTPGGWRSLDGRNTPFTVSGRLIGGCIETTGRIVGTPFGDVPGFIHQHANEGAIVYLEASGDEAGDIARDLWQMRMAGWFDKANAILIGRTEAPATHNFTQLDAVRSALADLPCPVLVDVDCGHVVPHLALVNGAFATVTFGDLCQLTQSLK